MPSGNAIAQQYTVAAETARKALGVLAAEGLTEVPARGRALVRMFRPILRRGTKRLAQSDWSEGRSIQDDDLDGRPLLADRVSVDEQPCPAHIAPALRHEAGAPVWVRTDGTSSKAGR